MNQEKITITLTKEEAQYLAMEISARMDQLQHMKEEEGSILPAEDFYRRCDEEIQMLEKLYRRVLRASP